jgi:energy-coupling factor transporter ATP-binding protein EcfA2
MAHILAFTVEGLGGRTGVFTKTLNRDVNVFFGHNGVGKTSLLRILNAAMDENPADLIHVPFISAEVKVHSVAFKGTITVNIDRDRGTSAALLAAQASAGNAPHLTTSISRDSATGYSVSVQTPTGPPLRLKVTLPDDSVAHVQPSGWAHGWLPTSRLFLGKGLPAFPLARTGFSEEALNQYFAQALTTKWSTYSAGTLGRITRAQQEGLAKVLRAVLSQDSTDLPTTELDPHIAFSRMRIFLSRQGSVRLLKSEEDFVQRYSGDRLLARIATDIDVTEMRIAEISQPRERLQELISKMFAGKQVSFTDNSIEVATMSGERLPLEGLSSGEKQALRILTEALQAETNTLLIDEPELSLNVDWQRTLIQSMQTLAPNIQIVAATHSPEIMADVADDKVFRL